MAVVELDFHTGLADKLQYACRLARKAWRSGHRVVITGQAAELGRLDQLLWTFEPGAFVPHARLASGAVPAPRLRDRTPIWLAEREGDAPDCSVLINLGPGALDGLARWARVIELVAAMEDDVASGRARWRHYRAAGHEPRNHTVAGDTD